MNKNPYFKEIFVGLTHSCMSIEWVTSHAWHMPWMTYAKKGTSYPTLNVESNENCRLQPRDEA